MCYYRATLNVRYVSMQRKRKGRVREVNNRPTFVKRIWSNPLPAWCTCTFGRRRCATCRRPAAARTVDPRAPPPLSRQCVDCASWCRRRTTAGATGWVRLLLGVHRRSRQTPDRAVVLTYQADRPAWLLQRRCRTLKSRSWPGFPCPTGLSCSLGSWPPAGRTASPGVGVVAYADDGTFLGLDWGIRYRARSQRTRGSLLPRASGGPQPQWSPTSTVLPWCALSPPSMRRGAPCGLAWRLPMPRCALDQPARPKFARPRRGWSADRVERVGCERRPGRLWWWPHAVPDDWGGRQTVRECELMPGTGSCGTCCRSPRKLLGPNRKCGVSRGRCLPVPGGRRGLLVSPMRCRNRRWPLVRLRMQLVKQLDL